MTDGGLAENLAAWNPEPLRKALRAGGFQHESLSLLGIPERWLGAKLPRVALLGHAGEGSPVETLLRLFTLGDAIDGRLALSVLGEAIHGLLEIGFLTAGDGVVRSHFQLCPMGDGWVACDFQRRQQSGGADYVMGIGPSSIALSELTPRNLPGRALELACGIGWLAGNLAGAGMKVVATDVNPRALDLARFSAKLIGTPAVDLRPGDGFAPVAGETFDLIVANPPYVRSPGGEMTFREGRPGEDVCARLLRELPDHLAPDGIAIVMLNWTHADDDDWPDAPLSWVPAEGARRWLFRTECASPADYAWKWISSDPRFGGQDAALAEMRRWLAWYRETGAARVSGGFMAIQKCAPGSGWTRSDSRSAENIGAGSGAEILRVIRNETWLATRPDLLETEFAVPAGIRAEAQMTLGPGGWERETIRLTSSARLAYNGQIDENILRLLALVREGKRPSAMVAEILARPEFAGATDLPERISALVRELVSYGMLVPK